jgi:hypothetical protein
VLDHLAHHEAAHFMRSEHPPTLVRLPATPTLKEYDNAVDRLIHPHDPGGENERAAKIRHPWTVHGVKTTGTRTVGFLQMCLEAAKAVGFCHDQVHRPS